MKHCIKIVFCLSLLLLTTHCSSKDGIYTNLLRSDVFVQGASDQKYDFLFVFDTSGSFQSRRDYVRDNMQTFLNILNSRKAIDYQIAVTSLDMFGGVATALPNSAGVRGNLATSSSGISVVKSATSANPAADFAGIMASLQPSDTSFWEQGLESAYQAVTQHGSQFSRTGVPLIVIFMTDSDDWSCQDQCWGVEPEHNNHWVEFPLARYVNFFQTIKSNENSEVIVFPIVGMTPSNCSIEFPGNRYIAIQQALGGLSQSSSVCSSDIASSFDGVANIIANRGTTFKLNQTASATGFNVYVNNQLVPFSPDNYIFDAASNSIIFTGFIPSKGAMIQVTYNQKN
jgi:hypothetical protein